jgi:hypothetical protein
METTRVATTYGNGRVRYRNAVVPNRRVYPVATLAVALATAPPCALKLVPSRPKRRVSRPAPPKRRTGPHRRGQAQGTAIRRVLSPRPQRKIFQSANSLLIAIS